MKKFENIIIASDLDGTFLSSGVRSEVARNIEKIKYFTDNGGLFTFSTGRIYPHIFAAAPHAREYVNCPMVSCNGMALYDPVTDTSSNEVFIDSAFVADIVNMLYERYPDVGYRGIARDGVITFQPDNPYIKREMDKQKGATYIVDRRLWGEQLFHKLTLRGAHETLLEIQAIIEEKYPSQFALFFSEYTIFEIQPTGVSKATLLLELRDMLSAGGERKTLYAVGDYENDYEMLQAADVAVCPANALETIKDICDLCLCDNDTGVIADLIEYIDKNTEG
ncbi:MAG: HAD-IIB family hydrolase [Clostridia bacterium]|nr:HAD-IIB family hydrolase [Clostridia bacterium]